MAVMEEEHTSTVVIVGAGIAGLATAVALKLMGLQSLVLERSHELRTTGGAIILFANAWRVLETLGVAGKLAALYQPSEICNITDLETGRTTKVHYARTNESSGGGIWPVDRKVLLEALAEELPAGSIRFSSRLVSIGTESLESSSHPVSLHFEDGSTIRAKALIGCDGEHSVVAQWLGLSQPIRTGRTAVRGMSVFPDGHGLKMEAYQYLKDGKRAGLVPLNDREVYWFIHHHSVNTEIESAGNPELIMEEVTKNLAKDFPEEFLEAAKRSEPRSLTWDPLMLRNPWNLIAGGRTHRECVTVAGDAMHPMTPELGQGGCTALEDAVVFARCVGRARTPSEFAQGIETYVGERKWRVAGLTTAAYLCGGLQLMGGAAGPWLRVVKWLKGAIFHRLLFGKIMRAIYSHDSGALIPVAASDNSAPAP